jgi:hypothetical protein
MLPSENPVFDDGAFYYGACMERRAFGADPIPASRSHSRSAPTGLIIDGDQFHRSCWQVLVSQDLIRVSRSLSQQHIAVRRN